MIPPIHLFLRRTQFSCTSARATHTCLLHVRTLFPRIYTDIHAYTHASFVPSLILTHSQTHTRAKPWASHARSLARSLSLSLSLSHSLSPAGLGALCSPENTEHLSRSPSFPLFQELRSLAVNLRRSPAAGKSDPIGLEFAVKFNFLEGRTRIWYNFLRLSSD